MEGSQFKVRTKYQVEKYISTKNNEEFSGKYSNMFEDLSKSLRRNILP